jgi:hypothetical protein
MEWEEDEEEAWEEEGEEAEEEEAQESGRALGPAGPDEAEPPQEGGSGGAADLGAPPGLRELEFLPLCAPLRSLGRRAAADANVTGSGLKRWALEGPATCADGTLATAATLRQQLVQLRRWLRACRGVKALALGTPVKDTFSLPGETPPWQRHAWLRIPLDVGLVLPAVGRELGNSLRQLVLERCS